MILLITNEGYIYISNGGHFKNDIDIIYSDYRPKLIDL